MAELTITLRANTEPFKQAIEELLPLLESINSIEGVSCDLLDHVSDIGAGSNAVDKRSSVTAIANKDCLVVDIIPGPVIRELLEALRANRMNR